MAELSENEPSEKLEVNQLAEIVKERTKRDIVTINEESKKAIFYCHFPHSFCSCTVALLLLTHSNVIPPRSLCFCCSLCLQFSYCAFSLSSLLHRIRYLLRCPLREAFPNH